MRVEEDSRLCQVLRAKSKEIPPFKGNLQNTISQSLGVLFLTFHSDCSKFFSSSHQMVFLSAGDIASYSTKQSFLGFFPPEIFSPIHSCFRRDLFCSFSHFRGDFHPEIFPKSCKNLKFHWSSVMRYLTPQVSCVSCLLFLVSPSLALPLWPSNLTSSHTCGHSSFRNVLISKFKFFLTHVTISWQPLILLLTSFLKHFSFGFHRPKLSWFLSY